MLMLVEKNKVAVIFFRIALCGGVCIAVNGRFAIYGIATVIYYAIGVIKSYFFKLTAIAKSIIINLCYA